MSREKDNLVRMLQDKKPLASVLCKFGWHRWNKWEITKELIVQKSGVKILQMHKTCDNCGFKTFNLIAPKEIREKYKNMLW